MSSIDEILNHIQTHNEFEFCHQEARKQLLKIHEERFKAYPKEDFNSYFVLPEVKVAVCESETKPE